MACYSFEGFVPVVDPTAFVHPSASLIGDVIVGARCYIAPGASLRGDFARIVLEDGCNVQDNCVIHTFPGQQVLLERDTHVGHGAVLHSCTIRHGALIGIQAIVMDEAIVGAESFVGAGSFVKGRFEVPARTLVTGTPARVVRALTDDEVAWKTKGTQLYQNLAARSLASLKQCAPLPAPEPGRTPLTDATHVPLHVQRSR